LVFLGKVQYLLPPHEYPRLLEATPDIDEFVESRIVVEALRSGDATNLLNYPGQVFSTFCQLWPEHHSGARPQITWPKKGERADAECAAHLGLFLSVVPPETYLRSLDSTLPGYRILIDVCATGVTNRDKIEKLSFLDELVGLDRSNATNSWQRV
jgi:hypothetical protein